MLLQSELVFEGEVLSSESKWNRKKTFIHTYVNFRVDDVIKGNYSGNTLTLSFAGGEIDGAVLQVSGMKYPDIGEKGVFFIEQLNKPQVNPFIGWGQGHFIIAKDQSGTDRVLTENKKMVLGLEQMESTVSRALRSNRMQPFAHGVAEGLRLGQDNEPLRNAMEKRVFISSIKQRLVRLMDQGYVE